MPRKETLVPNSSSSRSKTRRRTLTIDAEAVDAIEAEAKELGIDPKDLMSSILQRYARMDEREALLDMDRRVKDIRIRR